MTANDRRMAIVEYLCEHRSASREQLQIEFNVCHGTIDNDITVLSCSYPIYTVPGRYGGGVFIEDGYYVGKQYLTEEQESVLRSLASTSLDTKTQATLNSILDKFGHKRAEKSNKGGVANG